jgi:uncharacterized repeat protein (TIGR03803 family)
VLIESHSLICMKMTAALWLVVKRLRWRTFHILAAVLNRRCHLALAAAVGLPCFAGQGAATTGVTVVHTFSAIQSAFPSPSVNSDGASPGAGMTLGSDGNLYGTTTTGGINGAGIIFSLSPNGKLTDLWDFQPVLDSDSQEFYGFGPNELTAGPMGFFYGTTQGGGTNRTGTIFKMAPSGQEVDVYVFSAAGTDVSASNPDGMIPTGALVLGTNGNFYGTTQYGGTNGNGTIFQVTPNGAFTSVYSFSALGGASFNANADGATPNGLTLGTDGNFYGTTQRGGSNGAGTFFEFTISGALTPLYSFGATDNDAASPQAALAQGPNGSFYGTSASGSSALSGTIFEVTPSGAETVLYSFSGGNDGGLPNTALTFGSDGNFYGTTSSEGLNGYGTLFKITPAGAFSSLYSFAALNTNSENPIGANPSAALAVGRDGNLYGSCAYGGANGTGTIFRYTNAAFVSLVQPPLITSQPPAKLSGLAGLWVTLSMAAKGAPPLAYQWVKNKTNLLSDGGPISGSATGALVVGPLTAGDAGSYSVIVTNNFGATNSSATILTVTPDTTPPSVKIVSPAANARTNSPVFNGTASDNARVTNVVWWLTNLNGGPVLSGAAALTSGGSNWSFAVTPFPGTNVLVAQSVDSSGNKSKTASRTNFCIVTSPLSVLPGGDGSGSFGGGTASVKGDAVPANGALLNIGEEYSIKAVAGGASLFSNWVGSSVLGAFTNAGAALPFIMQSNLVLTANFASNFFLPAHATYNGLFYNTNAVAAESSGMLQNLLLATNGTFSGQLLKAGTTYYLSGGFDVSGNYSTNFGPASAPGGVLKVNLAVDRVARRIVGTVSNTQWTANLTAEPAGTNLPSAEYTLLLAPSSNAPALTPPGDGYGLATNQAGRVTIFNGQLADGTSFTPSASESQSGDLPVYASLYGNTGLLLGWINLTNLEAGPPANTLVWIKKASRATAFYTNGFTNTLSVQGALWTNPPLNTPAISLPEGTFVISNTSLSLIFYAEVISNDTIVKLNLLPPPATQDASAGNLEAVVKLTGPFIGATNSLTGSIAPKTGQFTLTFGNGNGKATTAGYGAVLQSQASGGGFFLGTTNAGSITFFPGIYLPGFSGPAGAGTNTGSISLLPAQ